MIGFELSPGWGQRIQSEIIPLAAFFPPATGQSVAVSERRNGGINLWTELAPNYAACMRLDNDNAATRLSWRETLVMELRNIYPVGDLTLTGNWVQLQTSGVGFNGSYTGNRAVSTSSTSPTASVTVDRSAPYDLWIYFTARTSGAFARVDIDGSQALVDAIDDPAGLGFKAFSTYSAADLQRRQAVKVATGLTGSHTVTISNGGGATPGGTTLMLEAVGISGSLEDPRILPPAWQPNTDYAMGDEVQYQGIYYAARATGTSGTEAPTHTGGIDTDGALDWRADNRPTYPQFVCIDYASEREYAVSFTESGPSIEVGGQTHGNEDLQSRTILVDDSPWAPAPAGAGLSVGANITITEQTVWQAGAAGDAANCTLVRRITPGAVQHEVNVVGIGPTLAFDWCYLGMAPFVPWDGESRSLVADSLQPAQGATVTLADYESVSNASIDFDDVSRIGITATVGDASLRYGHEAGLLAGPNNRVNQLDTFLRPNLNATAAGSGLDWLAKAYIVGSADGGLTLTSGDALRFFSRHVLTIDLPASG
ncbi:hypothetical protein [Yoonia sp. SS1-5]|uniref:Uncharacterized protein n=1 Tax=Yoonia rhodophyticola TaxID=3137370 RepID=A0AAN0MCG3_9RHOB